MTADLASQLERDLARLVARAYLADRLTANDTGDVPTGTSHPCTDTTGLHSASAGTRNSSND